MFAPQGILKLEKAGTVGLRTLALFMFTAACAAMQGIGVFFVFAPWILQLKVGCPEFFRDTY